MTPIGPTAAGQLVDESAEALHGGKAMVVVGVDGSAASDEALRFAVREAQLRNAILRIVTSHDLAAVTYGYAGMFDIGPFEDASPLASPASRDEAGVASSENRELQRRLAGHTAPARHQHLPD